jgi:hypothetical protein
LKPCAQSVADFPARHGQRGIAQRRLGSVFVCVEGLGRPEQPAESCRAPLGLRSRHVAGTGNANANVGCDPARGAASRSHQRPLKVANIRLALPKNI